MKYLGKIYNTILESRNSSRNLLAVLIDPDKQDNHSLLNLISRIEKTNIDFIFVGGSFLRNKIDSCIHIIKDNSTKPIVLFPGHSSHISEKADAILLLSLVSGRNPEFLIGNHIIAAPLLHQTNIEIISTAYILIDGGIVSSVQYVSGTTPIPADKPDIVVATALAAEMIGHKLIYLEAGSGALNPIPDTIIKKVHSNIDCPIIVGGGIRNINILKQKYIAGANLIVIGNAIETNNLFLQELNNNKNS